jgi:hypothetical protein
MVRLELRQPDYRLAGQVRDRINQCFGGPDKVALARDPSLVDVRIPASYRRDYVHFLRLVLHVPLMGGPGDEETQARELARVILLPTALGDDISLVWEAMGRRVLPVVRELYTSDNPAAAFYSLRAGLGLDDALAVEPMTRVAIQNGAAFQIQAIEALGRARKFVECVPTLRNLLSGHSDLVRVAAYEALLEHGSAGIIRRLDVSGQFMLDVVESERDYAVYVTRTGQPKIVLFGQKIPIRRPVFYCPEDELVTINAGGEDEKIKVDRKVPRSIRRSDTFEVVPQVAELVQALGTLPNKGIDGKIEGLGLTYSQVVGVVYGLQKGGHMPARFVLQPLPEMRRIYASMSGAGRPDMPDEGR